MSTPVPGPAARVAALAARDPGPPLVTWYDDSTGERTELSRATAQNWVAKTAGFLVDDCDVEPGDRVALVLHPHWQTTVTLLACWTAGAAAVVADPARGAGHAREVLAASGAAVAVAREDLLDDLAGARGGLPALRELVGASQRPMAARLRGTPPRGVLDLAAEVPPQPDVFAPVAGPHPTSAALVPTAGPGAGEPLDVASLLARAEAVGAALALSEADRLLVAPAPDTAQGVLGGCVAPALVGAGVVLCRSLPPGDALTARLAQERVTLLAVTDAEADGVALAPGGTGGLLRAVVRLDAGDDRPPRAPDAGAAGLAQRLGLPLLSPA